MVNVAINGLAWLIYINVLAVIVQMDLGTHA
jgi:hypothetical protein